MQILTSKEHDKQWIYLDDQYQFNRLDVFRL